MGAETWNAHSYAALPKRPPRMSFRKYGQLMMEALEADGRMMDTVVLKLGYSSLDELSAVLSGDSGTGEPLRAAHRVVTSGLARGRV